MRAPGVLALLGLSVVLARCVLFTGGTDGYRGPDAGCQNAADCDAGQVCCIEGLASTSQVRAACGSAPCAGPVSIQLCALNDECEAGLCVAQQCSLTDASPPVELHACGGIALCAAQ